MLRTGPTAATLVFLGLTLAADPLQAECRWIVRAYVSESLADRPTFDIVYDGLERQTFYAFSVLSEDLAERIEGGQASLDLGQDIRPLETVTSPLDHTVYRLDPASRPADTVYLVAAREPVPALERAGAGFVPARPTLVSQYVPRTRGATDRSGPLPRQSDVTVVAEAGRAAAGGNLTICAYAVPLG